MRKLLVTLFVLALLAALAVTGAGVAGGATVHSAKVKKKATVTMNDDYYSPTKVTIKRKGTVTWDWGTGTENDHSVVEQHGKFASSEKATGTYKHKFKKAGTFKIYCSVHPDTMKMKVIVKK